MNNTEGQSGIKKLAAVAVENVSYWVFYEI
jgi:hypothetical protein